MFVKDSLVQVISRLDIYGTDGDDVMNVSDVTGPTYIHAGGGDDIINIADASAVNQLIPWLTVDGGTGDDTLVGADTDATWNITSQNSGKVNTGLVFTGVENLTGGAKADAFVFADGAGVDGSINGKEGNNTLNWSAYTTPVKANLATGKATGIGGQFTWIENFVGSSSTADELTGFDLPNTWSITANNAGNIDGIFNFSSFENLTGGSQPDWFQFADGKGVSGNIDGALGRDTLDWSAYTTPITVNLGLGTANGIGGVFARIENVIGGQANDTLIGPLGDVNWFLTGNNQGTAGDITYSSFENITGGAGNDHFVLLPNASVSGKLDGGDGIDTIDYSLWTTSVYVDLSIGQGPSVFGGKPGGLTSIENASGGSAADTLIGSAVDNVLMGNAGNDKLVGGEGNDTLNPGSGDDNADGGIGNDLYVEVPGSNDVFFDSGGIDTVDFSGATKAISFDLRLNKDSSRSSMARTP